MNIIENKMCDLFALEEIAYQPDGFQFEPIDAPDYEQAQGEHPVSTQLRRIFMHGLPSDEACDDLVALLDTDIDVNAVYCAFTGWSPIHYASYCGVDGRRYAAFKILLERGANPNLKTADGQTPLIMTSDDPIAVQLLIDHGAEVNACEQLDTALHYAAAQGAHESVAVLVANGADPTIKDVAGETPEDVCRRKLAQPDPVAQQIEITTVYDCRAKREDLQKCLDLLVGGSATKAAVH